MLAMMPPQSMQSLIEANTSLITKKSESAQTSPPSTVPPRKPIPLKVRGADELFFTPSRPGNRYIALAHSRNYGLPALPRAFFARFPANQPI
jgi:hypothetical protein